MADAPMEDPVTERATPVQRSGSADRMRQSPDVKSSLSKSGSEGQLKDLTNSPRKSAPNSAKSDIRKHKPLPPIGAATDEAGGEKPTDGDEFASVTESELAEDDVGRLSDEEGTNKKKKVTKAAPAAAKVTVSAEIETQTEWSWIETMKKIQRQKTGAKQQLDTVVIRKRSTKEWAIESQRGGRVSVGSKTSHKSKAISTTSRRHSTLLKQDEEPESSITGPVDEGVPEIMTTLVLPYRDDEYGVPVLQFSESDTDSDSETTVSKPKTNRTLPSIGPPQILQYKRDNKPSEKKSDASETSETDRKASTAAADQLNIDTVNEMITFTGNCEFCNNPIKPFPTLHQQQILPPQELYCCEEFANFVRLAILPPPPNAHLIDIKPHAHFGSKQARAAAREKAQARIREREMAKAQAQAVQSAHSGTAGSGGPSGGGPAERSGGGGGGGGGGGHQQSSQGGAQMGGGGGGGGGNMFAYARAMKTINFQLSSQKCIDEGYVVRPPSPLADQELVANPFEIEPMEWFTAGVGGAAGDPGSDDEGSEDESPFTYREKQSRKDVCVERFYPNEEKFLTMFPDGTGNVFYPNGQLAISVSSVERGKFTYIVYDTQPQEDAPQSQLAEFDPDAVATCYHKSGQIRLYLDQLGGMELHQDGSRKKRWHWLDTTTHMHAPPVQPLCFALNKYIGIRVLNQDNISMTFLSYQRSCRFNVGVKLKLIHPENLPLSADFSDDHIYMSEKANQVSGLLDKIENLLRYPHSIKADKIKEPKRVTIKAEKIQKYKNQATVARQKDKDRHTKKFSRPLPPLDPDIDPVLMTETGEIITGHSTHRGGRGKHPVVVVN